MKRFWLGCLAAGCCSLFWIEATEPLLLPHFTFKQGQWTTDITLQNPTSTQQVCQVEAFDSDGNLVGTARWHIPAKGAVHGPIQALIPNLSSETGWLRIQRESAQISGTMAFTATASGGTSTLPFSAASNEHLAFPLLRNNAQWASGLVLLNPNTTAADVSLAMYAMDGSLLSEETLSLAAGRKHVAMAADLTNTALPELTTLRVSADNPIQAFGLSFAAGLTQIVAVPADPWQPGLLPALESAVSSLEPGSAMTGYSIGLQRPNEDAVVAAGGLADRTSEQNAQPQHAMRIGSLSKSFTAALILLLAEDGLLRLTDTVDTWWPDFPRGDEITVEMLLRHRSGLADLYVDGLTDSNPFVQAVINRFDQNHAWTTEEILAFSLQQGFRFNPGESGEYSNSGYTLLAWIATEVSGKSLAELLETRLFQPLNLDHTFLAGAPRSGTNPARAYLRDDGGWFGQTGAVIDISDRLDVGFTYGAGGLVSTPADLIRWNRALLGGKLLQPASLETMLTTTPVGTADGGPAYLYGLGLYALNANGRPVTDPDAIEGYGHSGATWGGTAFMFSSRDAQTCLALVSNQFFGNTDPLRTIGFEMLSQAAENPNTKHRETDTPNRE